MWQTILVGIILAATLFFAVRWIVRTVKGKGGCGCQGCPHSGKRHCHCSDCDLHLPDIDPGSV